MHLWNCDFENMTLLDYYRTAETSIYHFVSFFSFHIICNTTSTLIKCIFCCFLHSSKDFRVTWPNSCRISRCNGLYRLDWIRRHRMQGHCSEVRDLCCPCSINASFGTKRIKNHVKPKITLFQIKKNPNNVSRGTVEVLYSITLVLWISNFKIQVGIVELIYH